MIQDARARIRNLIGGEDKLSKSEPNLLLPRTDEYPTSPTEGKEQVLSSDTLDSGIFDDVIIDVADLAEDRNRLESQLERMQELHDENDTLKAEYAQVWLNNFLYQGSNSDRVGCLLKKTVDHSNPGQGYLNLFKLNNDLWNVKKERDALRQQLDDIDQAFEDTISEPNSNPGKRF